MVDLLESINTFLWGVPVLLLIVVVGLYLSIRSGFAQFRLLPRAFCRLLQSVRTDHGSGYRALCTALAATVGTGNLAGVAGAIAVGGPGVVFWMWICGFYRSQPIAFADFYYFSVVQADYLDIRHLEIQQCLYWQLWLDMRQRF